MYIFVAMNNIKFQKGCGCSLVVIGSLAVVLAIIVAVVAISADENAAVANQKEWAEYNAWVAEIDTISDDAVVDSLLGTRNAPITRQGGFASAFGVLSGIILMLLAALPLSVGGWLLWRVRNSRKEIK